MAPVTITISGFIVYKGVSYTPGQVVTLPLADARALINAGYATAGGTGPTDTTAPTAPASVSAAANSATSVTVTWTASTDAVGVTGYRVLRGGTQVATTGSGTLTWTDTAATASTTYTYAVKAVDAAGNVSTAGTAAAVTTPASSGGGGGGVTPTPAPTVVAATQRGDYVQRIAVPSYFWASWYTANGGDWARMQAAAPVAEIAIVNNASGPGTSLNTDWQTQAKLAKAAGMTVIGYVSTNYTGVSAATVKAQIDQHYAWYGVDGIFLDEADNPIGGTIANTLAYYGDLYAYVQAKGGIVVINPGQPAIDERLMQACDIVLNYENSAANYPAASFPAWTVNYPARRFWHVIYGVTGAGQRDALLMQARARRAGYVYLTTDVYVNPATDNPYDILPPEPFWSGLVAAVSEPVQAGTALRTLPVAPTQTLLWDGTNGGTPDAYGRRKVNSAQWTYSLGGGETPIGSGNRWGNNELQAYLDDLDHVWVKDGELHIKATRGTYPSPVAGEVTASFGSGRIHTQGKVTSPVNSYWEARVSFPTVSGTWGALWQMGTGYVQNADHTANWPQYGEIDIEWLGAHPNSVGYALHMMATGYTPGAGATDQYNHDAYIGHEKYGHVPVLATPISVPHTYGVWRGPTEIRYYIDHRLVDTDTQAQATAHGSQWPFGTGNQFFIINLAVGGTLGGSDLDGRDVTIGSMGAEMILGPLSIWTGVTDPAAIGLT